MPPPAGKNGYGCVIDAGSSGSRIYLYQWPAHEGRGDGDQSPSPPSLPARVEREAFFSDERSVGISHEGGIETLDELTSAAKSALSSHGVDPANVPIYLGATAGMRLLQSSSREAADAVMARARSRLHASGFLFSDEWARTISGEEESVFGWLVANYLKNKGRLPGLDPSSSGAASMYGALDLGGASTQISSLVSAADHPHLAEGGKAEGRGEDGRYFAFRLGNEVRYSVYTRSYLDLGADRARERFNADMAELDSKVNPCYPVGYVHPETSARGSSDWDECFRRVGTLFGRPPDSRLRGGDGGRPFDAVDATPVVLSQQRGERFVAMSVFVFVYDFLGLRTGARTEDLNALRAGASRVCNSTHAQQAAQYDVRMRDMPPGRKTLKPFAQCFNAAYAYHLLSGGYGFAVSETPIEIYYDIDGAKVQWALGMMLAEANNLDLQSEGKPKLSMIHRRNVLTSSPDFGVLFVAATLILSLVFALGGPIKCRRRTIPACLGLKSSSSKK